MLPTYNMHGIQCSFPVVFPGAFCSWLEAIGFFVYFIYSLSRIFQNSQKNNFLLSSISWLRKENQIEKKQKKYIHIRFCNKWFLNISWKKRKQGSNWTLTLAKAVALKVTREMKRENPCAGACNCMRNEMCCVLRKWRETGRTGQNVQAV